MPKATSVLIAPQTAARPSAEIVDRLSLTQEQRHVRRRLLVTKSGLEILVDLPVTTHLHDGDALVLDDGRLVQIEAQPEELFRVQARSDQHLLELAWHLGNRHLPTELHTDHLLIAREPVMRQMLEGLGAKVTETVQPFSPVKGAYHEHGHHHPAADHEHHP